MPKIIPSCDGSGRYLVEVEVEDRGGPDSIHILDEPDTEYVVGDVYDELLTDLVEPSTNRHVQRKRRRATRKQRGEP